MRGSEHRAVPISSKGLYRSDNGGYEDESSSLEDPTTVEELERRPKGVVVIRVGRPMFSSPLPDTHARQHSLASSIVIQSDSELAQQPERTSRLTSLETETFHDSEAENRPPMNHFTESPHQATPTLGHPIVHARSAHHKEARALFPRCTQHRASRAFPSPVASRDRGGRRLAGSAQEAATPRFFPRQHFSGRRPCLDRPYPPPTELAR